MGNETMIETPETPNVIEQKAAAPCFQVKRLVMALFLEIKKKYSMSAFYSCNQYSMGIRWS
jgi:hypothetical protein